ERSAHQSWASWLAARSPRWPPTPGPGNLARASRSRKIGGAGSYAHPFRLRAEGRLPAAEAVVLEPCRPHLRRLEEISPVNDDRGLHKGPDPAEVQRLKLLPVGEDDQRVGVPDRLEGRIHVGESVIGRIQPFELPGGGRVVDAQDGPGAVQSGDDPEAGRSTDVIRIRLERHAEYGDDLIPQHPQRPLDFREEPVDTGGVDALDLSEDADIDAVALSHLDERAQVLGQTGAAEAQTRVEEMAADPGV